MVVSALAVQYLEPGPHIASIMADEASAKLLAALERLPLAMVLLGWNLPAALLDACVDVCRSRGVALYRWHPLLCSDGVFVPEPDWQTVGLDGKLVPGYKGLPEFTFVCLNHPAVREAVLNHVREVLTDAPYQGIFLDRMRFPS